MSPHVTTKTGAAAALLNQAAATAANLNEALRHVESRAAKARAELAEGIAPGRGIGHVNLMGQAGTEVQAYAAALVQLVEIAPAILSAEGDSETVNTLWVEAVTAGRSYWAASEKRLAAEAGA
jgi:DNA-binding protein YbaB